MLFAECFLTGCSYTPSLTVTNIARLDNKLFVAADHPEKSSYVKIYDLDKKKWVGKTTFPHKK